MDLLNIDNLGQLTKDSAMLFYDLTIGAWVRTPGSTAPPPIQPVLTIGATYQIEVTFCRAGNIENVMGGTFYGGIKIKGDYAGAVVASDATPDQIGDNGVVFAANLTTTAGKAYFTANPTVDTVAAVFVIAATIDETEFKTAPLEITLQNDYFPEQ